MFGHPVFKVGVQVWVQIQLSNVAPLCQVPVEVLKAEIAKEFVLYDTLSHELKALVVVLTVSMTSVDTAAKSLASA